MVGANIEDHRQLPLFAKVFQFLHADSRNPPAARQQALALLRYGKVEDGYLVFSSPAPQRQAGGAAVQALG